MANANTFSVFGSARHQYTSLLPLLLRQHYTFYPNWDFVLMSDGEFDSSHFITKMRNAGLLKLHIICNGGTLHEQPVSGIAMLWRMIPIWTGYDYVFCRDLDSILTPRQLKYVTNFIASNQICHGINDNDGHDIPMMGGMVGFKCKEFVNSTGISSFAEMISIPQKHASWFDKKGKDQEFLMQYIWPRVKSNFILDKPSGPNDRCLLKDCVSGLQINHVSEKMMLEGDNFTNYIGAANCKNTTYGEKSLQEMVNFFAEHGNADICKKISQYE